MAHYDNKNFTRKDVVNISLDISSEKNYLIMLELKKIILE